VKIFDKKYFKIYHRAISKIFVIIILEAKNKPKEVIFMREEKRRLSGSEVKNSKFKNLVEEYNELNLTISDLEEIEGLIKRGPIYRLSANFKDYKGTPLKHLTETGVIAAADSIEKCLQELPLTPYKVFQWEFEGTRSITADFCPDFLLKVGKVEEYLKILVNFKDYIEQIEIAEAKIDFGSFGDSPANAREEVTKFKELFLDN
jgi:uncharacterized protein YdcH (DUF465 family)